MSFVWVMFAMCVFCGCVGVYAGIRNQKERDPRDLCERKHLKHHI
jgi:hypothetical protein